MCNPVVFGDDTPPFQPWDILQTYDDTCAIKSQELVLDMFGINDVNEDILRNEAISLNWYTPGLGTPIDAIGNLLELHGVHVNTFEHSNQYTLIHELAQGHQVIVGVDSGELWDRTDNEILEDILGESGADHALIVSGIDVSDPDNVQVVVTDPGMGAVRTYPFDQFADAWQDSSCFMVSTQTAPPTLSMPWEDNIMPEIMGMETDVWMSNYGDLLDAGIDNASLISDYLANNPELVPVVEDIAPLFFTGGEDVFSEPLPDAFDDPGNLFS